MINTRSLVDTLHTLESVAIASRVSSTNDVARRIVNECIENELSLPQAIIVAREQMSGRGRNDRTWSSPAGKGIYATVLLTRATAELSLLPLEMAVGVASYLREVFAIEAGVKWPNDVVAAGKKIAGILIEARIQEERAYLSIGIGVNVEPVDHEPRLNAVAIRELSAREFHGLDDATVSFIEHIDEYLSRPFDRDAVITEWRTLAVHKSGDRVMSVLPERTISGTWGGIDENGRALIRQGEATIAVSAGEIIVEPPPPAAE